MLRYKATNKIRHTFNYVAYLGIIHIDTIGKLISQALIFNYSSIREDTFSSEFALLNIIETGIHIPIAGNSVANRNTPSAFPEHYFPVGS